MPGFVPTEVRGQINGTITGGSVTGNFGDDSITASTINIGYFTSCYFITQGVTNQGFGGYNFVFAGQGAASGIANINPSDFTVSQYAPWIGNNNAMKNNVTDPAGRNINRSVTNLEDGGANIVISYKPSAASDPTNINFLQAYIDNTNGTGFGIGTLDNPNSVGPFYNERGVSGTGTNASPPIPSPLRTNLFTSSTIPGWMVDIPYSEEFGDATPGVDDTLTNETVTFQTFISSQMNIGGTNYNVLYGGIQWGYSFNTMDLVPEPSSVVLAAGFVGTALLWRRVRRRARSYRN
jgi:hypothetical protein